LDLHGDGVSERDLFLEYCREHSSDEKMIDKFSHSYKATSPISWYSTYLFVLSKKKVLYETINGSSEDTEPFKVSFVY